MQVSALQLILQAGFFVKIILLILASFSIVSWGIILYKYFYLRAASKESAELLAAVDAKTEIKELVKLAETLELSPLANLLTFAVAYGPGHRDELGKSLRRHESTETEKLHAYLIFLATIGSTAPFIGLLGTVWGIMDAFRGIGAAGSASLAVVAPAIAEALITTAAGLAAAIPAVMAYNYYINWVRRMTVEIEDFGEQVRDLIPKRGA